MKILVPLIKSNSGSDVYFQSLKDALSQRNVFIEIKRLSLYLEFAPYFAKTALFLKADVKNSALVHTNADYGSAFKFPGKPFVVTVHHNVLDESYQNYTSPIQKTYHYLLLKRRIGRAIRSADRVVAVSYSTKASLEQTFGATGIDVIYNGIDTDAFSPKKVPIPDEFKGKIKLLFVGNLTKRKGADLLPRIMERLGKDYILFYTSGLRSGSIFRQPNMVPLGTVPQEKLTEIYNLCDIFLLPSRLEGFGYAVAEAMACGKPVVCTNCSSLPELVIDQKGGFLCEQDNVEDFVEKIHILGKDEKLRQAMGQFNRQRILDNFTVKKMAGNYLSFYQAIV